MLRRYWLWRRENVEASLADWERSLERAARFGKSRGSRGLECRRVIARLERRLTRIQKRLGIADSNTREEAGE